MKSAALHFRFLFALLVFAVFEAAAAEFEVGPGKRFRAIREVPWESLEPGDRVSIFWREEPYREKWVICRRGSRSQPIVVRGVPGPGGCLPIIEGANAVAAGKPSYWGGARSVIKIGGVEGTKNSPPAWMLLENLEVRGGRPPFTFAGPKGVEPYAAYASAVWIENGDHVTVRGCVIHDSANGLFTSHQSSNIVVERCRIFGNGLEKSIYQHNSYTESNGITFQYNRFGPLRAGCSGNNLKDRSAGLVVRCNRIEGGNRELDLVDADDSPALRAEPAYRQTYVYGNLIIEPANDGNNQIVHYGGDMGKTDAYRKGTLYFYDNTVISRRTDKTTLFALPTNDERVDCRNNIIFVAAPGNTLALLDSAGRLEMTNNWLKPGWVNSGGKLTGVVKCAGVLQGEAPGFVDETAGDFHLAAGSPCRRAGGALPVGEAIGLGNDLGADFIEMSRGGDALIESDKGAR